MTSVQTEMTSMTIDEKLDAVAMQAADQAMNLLGWGLAVGSAVGLMVGAATGIMLWRWLS